MIGGKSSSSNQQMINFEKQQADIAAQKEADRQARLTSGQQQINDVFSAASDPTNPNYIDYEKYSKAMTDYYMPQEQTQFKEAQRTLGAKLANAGLLRSSAAGDLQALQAQEDVNNQASINSQAQTATAQLQSNIQNEKQQAINQLYATEDPTTAVNTATNMVQQGAVATPNLNPLGSLFSSLAVGGSGAMNSYLQNYYINKGFNTASATGAQPSSTG